MCSDFLNATLTGLGFLNRTGILETAAYSKLARYRNVSGRKKNNLCRWNAQNALNNRLYGFFWGTLEEGLRTGKPQNEAKHGENLFQSAIYKSPELL